MPLRLNGQAANGRQSPIVAPHAPFSPTSNGLPWPESPIAAEISRYAESIPQHIGTSRAPFSCEKSAVTLETSSTRQQLSVPENCPLNSGCFALKIGAAACRQADSKSWTSSTKSLLRRPAKTYPVRPRVCAMSVWAMSDFSCTSEVAGLIGAAGSAGRRATRPCQNSRVPRISNESAKGTI
jgi:hypothetical protein